MIYTGLGRLGEIADVKAHGGADVTEVYGGINEANPIYYKTRTLTGTPPLSYKALGQPLSDYLISGNTIQEGTPTPEAPMDIVGCGVRTGNLWDGEYIENIAFIDGSYTETNNRCIIFVPIIGGNSYTFSIKSLKGDTIIQSVFSVSKPAKDVSYKINGVSTFVNHEQTTQFTRTAPAMANWLSVQVKYVGNLSNDIMLNAGSTAIPYEPYGYKLPLTVNGTEYPIYLGQVETTRRIKKMVLTGEENWNIWASGQPDVERYYYKWGKTAPSDYSLICTHFSLNYNDGNYEHIRLGGSSLDDLIIYISKTIASTVADFKSYLAAQYAAGTPVTVWYVLAEPETGIVNEPLMKIGNYSDTIRYAQAGVTIPTATGENFFDMTSPVKPSEVYIKGNIKAIT